MNGVYCNHLRKMIWNDFKRKTRCGTEQEDEGVNWRYKFSNTQILEICKTPSLKRFIQKQQFNWYWHLVRSDERTIVKQLTFSDEQCVKMGKLTTLRSSIVKNHCKYNDENIQNIMKKKSLRRPKDIKFELMLSPNGNSLAEAGGIR